MSWKLVVSHLPYYLNLPARFNHNIQKGKFLGLLADFSFICLWLYLIYMHAYYSTVVAKDVLTLAPWVILFLLHPRIYLFVLSYLDLFPLYVYDDIYP